MTVLGTESRVKFNGTGVTAYPLGSSFQFFLSSDLVVTRIDVLGVETLLTEITDYTVSGGDGSTGTVNTVATYSDGQLIVYRDMEAKQTYDAQVGDGFNTDTFEDMLDRMMMLIQQVQRNTTSAIRLSELDTTVADPSLPLSTLDEKKNKVVGFDAAGALALVSVIADLSGYTISSANVADAIAQRDSNGDFAARIITALTFLGNFTGDVTGDLFGNADTATLAAAATDAITATKHGVGAFALNVKTIDIGNWDMNSSSSPAINPIHGITLSKIISADVLIFRDDGALSSSLFGSSSTGVLRGTVDCSTSAIILDRTTGGFFDGPNYSAVGNRGRIKICYID